MITSGAAEPLPSPADLLKEARLSAGMTQMQLAAAAGVDQATICKYETGERDPGSRTLLRLLHVLRSVQVTDVQNTSRQPPSANHVSQPAPDEVAKVLRDKVYAHLRSQGFRVSDGALLAPASTDKGFLRQLHQDAVAVNRERGKSSLARHESKFVARLAIGADIDPQRIRPRLVLVENFRSMDSLAWRWCSLHWSIPVSSGYGRRLRFLVLDEGHDNKIMGLIGLADPVFALGARDAAIGWTSEQRRNRLPCVMEAFVLGAVPPYSDLLGGKLMALLATSSEVRDAFADRYGHRTTLIAGRDPDAHLALVTTSSALGRSSVYNRLKRPDGRLAFVSVGFTSGSGDFHFSGEIYDELTAFVASRSPTGATFRHARWGGGAAPRNRREVLWRAFRELGLDPKKMRLHGVRREMFIAPLATNTQRWLRGEDAELDWCTATTEELGRWWRERWAIRRAESTSGWREFSPADWRLYA